MLRTLLLTLRVTLFHELSMPLFDAADYMMRLFIFLFFALLATIMIVAIDLMPMLLCCHTLCQLPRCWPPRC